MKCWRFDGFRNLNLKWRINRRIPNTLLPSWGFLLGRVVNCLVVFPTHFNHNNSPLILLQISLLFTRTPSLTKNLHGIHEGWRDICLKTHESSWELGKVKQASNGLKKHNIKSGRHYNQLLLKLPRRTSMTGQTTFSPVRFSLNESFGYKCPATVVKPVMS